MKAPTNLGDGEEIVRWLPTVMLACFKRLAFWVGLIALLLLPVTGHSATVATTNLTGALVLTNGFGDFNLDRKIDVLDIVRLQNHLNGTRLLTVSLVKKADLDQDGLVTGADQQILTDFILQRRCGPDGDFDADGLTNAQEIQWQTNPFNRDTDGDKWWDGWEVEDGTDPLDSSSWLQMLIVASPPVRIVLPAPDEADKGAITLANPPIRIVFPNSSEAEERGSLIVAQPQVILVNTNK